jgi:hypothetical protein
MAHQWERRGDGAVGTGALASEGGGRSGGAPPRRAGPPGAPAGRENRSPELDDGSPPTTRFRVVGEVVKHG